MPGQSKSTRWIICQGKSFARLCIYYSFVSERIVQSLGLKRYPHGVTVSGTGGISQKSPITSISTFEISSLYLPSSKYSITAVVVPRVTCNLPLQPVYGTSKWTHISDLNLADPDFATPGKIELLLSADSYIC